MIYQTHNSVGQNYLECLHYKDFFGSTTTFQHRFNSLLFFVCLFPFWKLDTFPRSLNSICTYSLLGFCYRPVGFICAYRI
jgi:hypothetical protein